MTANTISTATRLTAAGAIATAIAAGAALAAPAANAAPVSPSLVLTQGQFPAGSTEYRTGPAPKSAISIKDGAPQACTTAAARLNAASKASQGVAASVRNGYSGIISSVTSPVQGSLWRATTQACNGRVASLTVPGDLAAYRPAVVTYRENGRVEGIEGVADVKGYSVDVYVFGLAETPANADRFWQVFRAQINKVKAAG